MPLVGDPTMWGEETQQGVILSALFDSATGDGRHDVKCPTCDAAYMALRPSLGSGALRFYRNPTDSEKAAGLTGRIELPGGRERGRKLRLKIREVHAYASDYVPGDPVQPEPAIVVSEPVLNGFDVDAEKALFMAEMRRLRPFAEDREIDHISYRPAKDARRMIEAGIPAKACLHAMTMHWEDATRAQARVADFDPARDFDGGLDAYLDTLAEARVLIMLTGPAGMGKSYWCQNLANRLGLEYGSIPMTEGATPSWILGAQRLNGFGESRFLQIWRDGGVFLLDEMDAADPNMLLVVNDALANGVLHNPVNAESYQRHPDCILIAATNTLGTGADASYTGRNQLDFSTLDRWRMGRAFVGYSESVEDAVMYA
jgi:hypothetical protein